MATRRAHRVSVLGGQRQAVERLKAALFGSDPYVRSRYIGDFHREFHSFREPVTRAELFAACSRADIVLVGDYHSLPSCQSFAEALLESLAGTSRPLVLFLEMVFSRDQRILDQYLAGTIDAEELRTRIRYDRDWGYPWEGYERLLRAARRAGVEVVAADAPPRGGLRMIRRRDRHAACKICERLHADPSARALVLFGESHMASGHLPGEVRRELARRGARKRSVVVVQNVEAIYWKLVGVGLDNVDAVRIGGPRYAVFNASPLAKYESYRQTLLRWAQQEDEAPDFGPSVHHLIDMLAGYLGLDPYRSTALSPSGGTAPLVDLYPEVVTRRDRRKGRAWRTSRDRALPPGSRAVPGSEPSRLRRREDYPGVVYRSVANRIEVYAFTLAAAAEAASRFLLAALRGRAGREVFSGTLAMPGPGEGSGRARPGSVAGGARGRRLPFAPGLLDEAFVAFSVRYLDPGVPSTPGRAAGPTRKVSSRRRTNEPGAGLPGLLAMASGAATAARGSPARAGREGRALLGQRLGEGVYDRLRKGSRGRMVRGWLLGVARFEAGSAGCAEKAEKLLMEGAHAAGWTRKKA